MGLYEQVDYDFSGLLHPQDLFGREYVTMGGVIDHHLTTTVQLSCKMSEKLVVMTNNRLFLVLGRNCAESTKFTFQRQSIPSCRSSPTWKARGSNPPGRTKKDPCTMCMGLSFSVRRKEPIFFSFHYFKNRLAKPAASFIIVIVCPGVRGHGFVSV